MQNVSAEWEQNMNSHVRKQGFVDITISVDDKTAHICSNDESGTNFLRTTHSRGYDPIGMSLPYNSVVIELLNYKDYKTGVAPFDWLYDSYEYSMIPVVIKYGFCMDSGNEMILGGTFVIRDITKDGDIICIECWSNFESMTDIIIRKASNMDSETVLFSLYGKYQQSVSGADLSNQETAIKFSEIKSLIREKGVLISSNTTLDNIEIYVIEDEDYTIGKAVQYISNISLQRCYIDRNGNLIFEENGKSPASMIKQFNMRSKPKYARGALLKKIECNTKSERSGSEVTTSDYNRRKGTGSTTAETMGFSPSFTGESKIYYRDYTIDWGNNIITHVTGNIVKIARSKIEITDTVTETAYQNNQWETYQRVVFTGQYTRGIKIWCYGSGIPEVTYQAKFTNTIEESEDYHSCGIICDINNPYGKPCNFKKIADYYDNRDIYELNLRGDPSIDVGDYVYIEMANGEYKKALVLESELTFDGSFKDNMKVRIIDTDFEEIKGNTHEELANKTHEQLSAYTHKQLTTEEVN